MILRILRKANNPAALQLSRFFGNVCDAAAEGDDEVLMILIVSVADDST